MAGYVYLLKHATEPRFKIGKAAKLLRRIQQIGADQFDLCNSTALLVEEASSAENLERLLHRAFSSSRLDPSTHFVSNQVSYSGDTEWFHIDCLPRAEAFIEANRDLFNCQRLSSAQFLAVLETEKQEDAGYGAAGVKPLPSLETRNAARLERQELTRQNNRVTVLEATGLIATLATLSPDMTMKWDNDATSCELIGSVLQENLELFETIADSLMEKALFGDPGSARILTSMAYEPSTSTDAVRYCIGLVGKINGSVLLDQAVHGLYQTPLSIPGWGLEIASSHFAP